MKYLVDGFCECAECGKIIEGMQVYRKDEFICEDCAKEE